MASQAQTRARLPLPLLVVGILVVIALVLGGLYLSRTPSSANTPVAPSGEAKAYLPNLQLSDVSMNAAENFMQQQVVEVQGKITNNGPRPIKSIDVYCFFRGVDGKYVYRERVPIVQAKDGPLKPGDTRHFRLPFDNLPDTWNQAQPQLVIAQITFAQ